MGDCFKLYLTFPSGEEEFIYTDEQAREIYERARSAMFGRNRFMDLPTWDGESAVCLNSEQTSTVYRLVAEYLRQTQDSGEQFLQMI